MKLLLSLLVLSATPAVAQQCATLDFAKAMLLTQGAEILATMRVPYTTNGGVLVYRVGDGAFFIPFSDPNCLPPYTYAGGAAVMPKPVAAPKGQGV